MALSRRHSRLYGLTVDSPFALPGALPLAAPIGVTDIVIEWEPETSWREIVGTLAMSVEHGGPRLGTTAEGGLCIEWRRELQLVIPLSNDRVTVVCRPSKLEFAPTVLVGMGMGLLLHRRGVACLHGSAVSMNGRSFALLGDSGAGKSTAAAALVMHGATLISDDLVALRPVRDGFLVEQGCANVRLDAAAKARILGAELELVAAPWIDKLLWDVSTNAPETQVVPADAPRLDAIYVLATAEGGGIDIGLPLAPFLALRQLVEAWYPQGCTPLLTQERLDDLRTVAARIPLFELRFPRRWDILPHLVEALGA